MNLDEQFLEMTDKIRLIKLENENVISFLIREFQKRQRNQTLWRFFYFDIQCRFI